MGCGKGLLSAMTGGLSDLFSGNIGGAATLGATDILGLTGQSKGGVSALQKQYGKTGADYLKLLNAYGAGLPQQLQWQQQYQPQYDALNAKSARDTLLGTNGNPGYLDLYQNDVVPAIAQATSYANTTQRAANVRDLATLGPAALAGIKNANPAQTGLMDQLTQNASDQLKLGTQLDPAQLAQINAATNSNWANRGLGQSNPAMLDNALQQFAGGQQLLQQRQAGAGTVAGMQNLFYTDPLLSMMGINSNAPGAAQPLSAAGAQLNASAGPSLLTPNDATSMLSGAFNANAATNISANNNKAALCGAGIGAAGSLAGGALSGLI